MGACGGRFTFPRSPPVARTALTIEIAATEGAIGWDSESPNRLWIGSRQAPNQVLERDPALLGPAAAAVSHYPGGHAEGFADTFKQLYLDVYGRITDGTNGDLPPTFPTFADGDYELRLCEAIAQSAVAEKWVPVTGYQSRLTTDQE